MMSTTIKIAVLLRTVLNCPGQGGLDGNRSTSEEINGIEKRKGTKIVDISQMIHKNNLDDVTEKVWDEVQDKANNLRSIHRKIHSTLTKMGSDQAILLILNKLS